MRGRNSVVYRGRVYRKASLESMKDLPDFIGFHCQVRPRRDISNEDTIGLGYNADIAAGGYGEYFAEILDSLPFELRDSAMDLGLLGDEVPSSYDDGYKEWHDNVREFLYDNGIRWIFVSENKPLTDYGDYCYAVMLDDAAVLTVIPDVGVNDAAAAYVYNSSVAIPKVVEVEET
jgi:hypothetical protein